MNDEYYASPIASTDFLMHYGVKGMKWGVRKAIDTGNYGSLSRHYKRASRKLAKLENLANKRHQENIVKASTRDQKLAGAIGAIDTGIAAGRTIASLRNAQRMADIFGVGVGNIYLPVGAGVAAGSAIANQIRKNKARKRLTSEGHRQAAYEANQFRNEMKKAFKGTPYAKKIDTKANEIAKKKRMRTASYLDDADRLGFIQSEMKSDRTRSVRNKKRRR